MDIATLRTLLPEIRPTVDAEQFIYDMLHELFADNENVHIMVETSLDTSAVFHDDQQVLILFSCTVPRYATSNLHANRWKFTTSFTVITMNADYTFSFSAKLAELITAYSYTQQNVNTAGRAAAISQIAFERQASSNQMNGKALKERSADATFIVVDNIPL